jgi:putative peptide zinc metalloprotease protein
MVGNMVMTDELCLPMRAPGVTLVGPLSGASFEEQQWLVQRGHQFLQVTELLYRVLEQADGTRTLAQLADRISETTDWLVTPEALEALIRTRLRPAGLIAFDGEALQLPETSTAAGTTRALSMLLGMRLIAPGVIEPITKWLQYLFAPIALVPLVCLSVITHLWAYRTNVIGDAVAATLYTPGGLLVALSVLVAGAVVHELGHAAALRYGGGHVRGIGVGLYLIFPAFYTDVTDVYRLGRSARVRTDLGGVYFHLLFATVLMLTSGATGNLLLLFAAVLVNLEMARQFIPFVRLDGYWLLADLTGVPDLFSQLKPFVRSLRGGKPQAGPVLPSLRPWAKAIFAIYIVITLPVLAYLFALLLIKAPAMFLAARDAFAAHAGLLQRGESWWMLSLAVTQMALLAIPAIGTVLIVLSVLAMLLAPLTSSLSLSQRSRGLAGQIAFATTCTLVVVWLSQGDGTGASMARSEPEQAIAQARTAIAAVKTLRAEVEGVIGTDHFTGTLSLKRPNLAHIAIDGSEGLGDFQVVSNGTDTVVYFPASNQFSRMPSGADGRHISAFVVAQVHHFFNPTSTPRMPPGSAASIDATDIADADYRVLQVEAPDAVRTVRYWISRTDGLIHRITYARAAEPPDYVQLRNIRLNEELSDGTFAWSLPTGATTLQIPVSLGFPGASGQTPP